MPMNHNRCSLSHVQDLIALYLQGANLAFLRDYGDMVSLILLQFYTVEKNIGHIDICTKEEEFELAMAVRQAWLPKFIAVIQSVSKK